MTWTPERIDELTQLWGAGHSASAIGKRLGVSKNAVVGKAHRLNLPARPSPIRRETKAAQPPRKRTPALAVPEAPAVVPPAVREERRRPPMIRPRESESRRQCQWPIGDPAKPDFHFCTRAAAPGKPYCAEHCAVAYVTKSRDKSSSSSSEAA